MMKELNKMVDLRDVVLFLDEKIGIALDLVNETEWTSRKEAYLHLNSLISLQYSLYVKFSNIGDE